MYISIMQLCAFICYLSHIWTYLDMYMSIMQLWAYICYLRHMWIWTCPLCNFENLYVTWHICGHLCVHYATLSIYMLLSTYLDMYISIIDSSHVPYICCRKELEAWICYLTHIWTYICPWSHITPLTWLQTCCQSTLQQLYWITHTTLRHGAVQHLTHHCLMAYGQNIEGSNGPGPLLACWAVVIARCHDLHHVHEFCDLLMRQQSHWIRHKMWMWRVESCACIFGPKPGHMFQVCTQFQPLRVGSTQIVHLHDQIAAL